MYEGLLAGALVLAQLPLPDSEFPTTVYTHHPYVEKLSCHGIVNNKFRMWSGTAFKLENGVWVSADHVTGKGVCALDGKPVTVINADPDGDVAVLVVADNRRGGLKVNCIGYSDRRWYFGLGHGRGDPFPQIVPVRYSALYTMIAKTPFGILEGNRFVPGMSGGPVLDEAGRVVGVVNAYGLFMKISLSRQLRDSVICKNSAFARR